jgi:hydrogenase/urease accessory protein HupE
MSSVRTAAIAVLVLVGALGTTAGAHSLSPALLELEELGGDRVGVAWKTSLFQAPGATLRPVLPSECVAETETSETAGTDSVTARWMAHCGPGGLVGREVGVEGLATGKTDALVRVTLADGRVVQGVLRGGESRLWIPERPRRIDVIRSYAKLGIEHILTGPDHLLFVFGLLLLVASPGLLVRTITAFTVGHSITLSLAALGLARVPSRPIEVGIAASVFLLAVELSRDAHPRATLMRRAPWLVAGLFGLLHGLGFAGALAEVGLPAGEIPTALFAFNVGIEIGQLCFVGLVLAVGRALASLAPLRLGAARWIPVYAMGALSALWCIERTLALVAPSW